jgi:hypothetical protein
MNSDNSVAIVGGGPCGLLTALLLARSRIRCTVFEKRSGISIHPKANGYIAANLRNIPPAGVARGNQERLETCLRVTRPRSGFPSRFLPGRTPRYGVWTMQNTNRNSDEIFAIVTSAAENDWDKVRTLISNSRRAGAGLGQDLGVAYPVGAFVPDDSELPDVKDPINDYHPAARPGSRAPHVWTGQPGVKLSTLDFSVVRSLFSLERITDRNHPLSPKCLSFRMAKTSRLKVSKNSTVSLQPGLF